MAATSSSVGTAFAIQIGLAIIVFLSFSYLRLLSAFNRFYAPKRFDKTLDHRPRRLRPGFFQWMVDIYTYPEADLIKVAGLDSAMYIRVLQFGWEVFVKVSLWTCIIILPINLTSHEVTRLLDTQGLSPPPPAPPPPVICGEGTQEDELAAKKYAFTNFDRCSLANIPASHPKMWAHMVVMYIITYIVLKTLWRYNMEATLLRISFLSNAPRGGPSHTALITDIPGMAYGTIAWYLRALVGSTLFIMLPGPLKKRVMDSVEGALGAVAKGLDVAEGLGPRGKKGFSDVVEDVPVDNGPAATIVRALSKYAAKNTDEAEAIAASRKSAASGVLRQRNPGRFRATEMVAADEKLDPWFQAGEVLGSRTEPKAHLVKTFIHDEMEFCYGSGCVAAVNPVWDTGDLEPLLAEYKALRQKLEDYLDKCAYMLRRRKPIKERLQVTVVGATLGEWGKTRYGLKPTKVDAIEFWCDRLRELSVRIPEAQAKCLKKAIPSAFVTFQTRTTQVTIATSLHHHDEATWAVQVAPEPKEIIWGSLKMRAWERGVRTLLLWGAYVALMLFYMIPVGAAQALIEVPKLADLPVLGTIVTLPFIRQILEAIVPGLVLLIFLALMPTILAFFCRVSGFVSTSSVDFGVVTRYFYFQLVSVFLGSIIAGSLFSQLKQFINRPASIITILGVGIPMTATFFINYILVAGIGKTGIKHLRIPGLVIFKLLSKFAATPRARARLWADQYTLYGPTVPYFTVTFLLGLTYCCINPIISPVVLVYFSFAIISERYNGLYVFKREYESGGRLWQYVFNQFVVSMYVAQITMIILLSIKQFPYTFLLIPAPIITFGYHILCLRSFQRPWTVMSSHDAAMLDLKDAADRGGEEMGVQELQDIRNMYLNPAFKVREEDIDELLAEAEMVSRRINGEEQEAIEADMEEAGYVTPVEDEDEWELRFAPKKADKKAKKGDKSDAASRKSGVSTPDVLPTSTAPSRVDSEALPNGTSRGPSRLGPAGSGALPPAAAVGVEAGSIRVVVDGTPVTGPVPPAAAAPAASATGAAGAGARAAATPTKSLK